MEQTTIYLLAEALTNVNLRANESTSAFLLFTIFSYFFFVITTAYLIRKLHLFARIISATVAIFFNFIMVLQIQTQVLIGKVLLNGLSKSIANYKGVSFDIENRSNNSGDYENKYSFRVSQVLGGDIFQNLLPIFFFKGRSCY